METSPEIIELMDRGRKLAHEQARKKSRELYLEIRKMLDSGMSQSEIARKLGMHRQSVSRIVLRNER